MIDQIASVRARIGHFGTGHLKNTIRSMADFERAQPLFDAAYQKCLRLEIKCEPSLQSPCWR